MKTLRMLSLLAVSLYGAPLALAALDGTADSSAFTNQYNGNQIWDGSAFVNDWVQSGGHTPAAVSVSGSNLIVSPDADNGWVQHDSDTTAWETGSGNWTIEVSVKLNDVDSAVNDGMVVWGERDGNRGVLWIQDQAVSDLNGVEIASGFDNTDGFHTYRIAFDSTDMSAGTTGTHHVWRDDVLLSGAGVDINLAGGSLSRLIVGDCCTNIGNPVDQYELAYIRYQPDMALAPVPEPNSIFLLCMGLLGLLRLRSRR